MPRPDKETASPPLRLLNVVRTLDPSYGGPAEGCRQRGIGLINRGHHFEVACLDPTDAPYLADLPFAVTAFGGIGTYGYSRALIPWLKHRRDDFDAVFVSGIWEYSALAVWWALHDCRLPYFLFTHGMLDPWFAKVAPLKHLKKRLYWRLVGHRSARMAAAVLYTAAAEKQRAARGGFYPFTHRDMIIPYGVEGVPDHLRGVPMRSSKRRQLLFLGRLQRQKSCDLLIHSFADLAAEYDDCDLVMAGPDRSGWKRDLVAIAAARGIADRILWPGILVGDEKWRMLQSAWGVVIPSQFESFGIVVVEALSASQPVVVSDQVAICEEVVRYEAGYVCALTQESLRAALKNLISLSGVERDRLAAAARRCFADQFENSLHVRRLEELVYNHESARSEFRGAVGANFR